MTLNAPTAPYRPIAPPAYALSTYLPYFIDKLVRLGRDNGYSNLIDAGIPMLLADFGVQCPTGGFIDSDGVNAYGRNTVAPTFDENGFDAEGYTRDGLDAHGFDRDGVNLDGVDRETAIETMVDGWDADYCAEVLTAIAARVA